MKTMETELERLRNMITNDQLPPSRGEALWFLMGQFEDAVKKTEQPQFIATMGPIGSHDFKQMRTQQNDDGSVTLEGSYDGVTWTPFTPDDGLIGAPVNDLSGMRDGSVYAGTDAGIGRFSGGAWSPFA